MKHYGERHRSGCKHVYLFSDKFGEKIAYNYLWKKHIHLFNDKLGKKTCSFIQGKIREKIYLFI